MTDRPRADQATEIARTILDGFDLHYWLFREFSARAGEHFARGEWAAAWNANLTRIDMYDRRVAETVEALLARFPEAREEALWPRVKLIYIGLLYEHLQPECAETFYNSVACRVLHRTYYNNAHLFWRPAISTEHLEGDEPTYRSYELTAGGLLRALRAIVDGLRLPLPFEDLRRDLRLLVRAARAQRQVGQEPHPALQIQVLSALFYRNQAAYVIGRVVNSRGQWPFAVPIRRSAAGRLYLDALLMRPEQVATLFSLARAYFMVDMEVPSAYMEFLGSLMPYKPRAELYSSVGLQKQGKTMLYRDLHHHLKHSTDRFVIAPGIRGMVMLVFTLPSFPYVFKLIRDFFDPPKEVSAAEVRAKYLLVKHHDRAGRMADTLEYSDVALPVARFDAGLLRELRRLAAGKIEEDGDRLVLRHVYIERRMVPLDIYLRDADEERLRHGIREYGAAIRELAGANIFPGDLLTKNFGVTRYGRVVFYDYDEICYLTECNFRRLPEASSFEDEMAAEPWYAVGAGDVFPEQFPTFLFPPGRARDLFLEHNRDLTDVAFWRRAQERVRAGEIAEVFPYPQSMRLRQR
jgi:isocitrate dehydrogenase kinase/phosphatase